MFYANGASVATVTDVLTGRNQPYVFFNLRGHIGSYVEEQSVHSDITYTGRQVAVRHHTPKVQFQALLINYFSCFLVIC